MIRTFEVTDIKYDTDGEVLDLPKTLIIDIPIDIVDDEEIDDYISDEISNRTGFCHFGFTTTEVIN